jgi:glucose/arabinose dehydrogenase
MELTSREREIPAAIEQHVSEEAPRLARLTDDREVDFGLVRHVRRMVSIVAAAALVLLGCGASPAESEPAAPSTAGQPGTAVTGPAAVPQLQVAGDVVRDLEVPWGIDFLPGGDALVTERDSHRILRVTPQGQVTPVGEVPEAEGRGQGGLLGLAVSPTFDADALLYVYFSTTTENRIERMTFDGTAFGPREPLVTGIPSAVSHNGGALEFGPDGMLYAGAGDATDGPLAQDPASLAGKILRMSPDGTSAPGNPFPGSIVYSLGHRNVQGLAFDSLDRLWASEFGSDAWDELNLIWPGGNYGWPQTEGRGGDAQAAGLGGDAQFVQPAAQWPVAEASPSGIAIVDDVVYMAALRGARVWQILIQGDGTGEPTAVFEEQYGRLRNVEQAPDGLLWVTTSNRDGGGNPAPGDDRILRVTFS